MGHHSASAQGGSPGTAMTCTTKTVAALGKRSIFPKRKLAQSMFGICQVKILLSLPLFNV
ncbi:hypothetical protein [Oceanobacillus neutriphilus]|uniref:Uncharacterized protein n=1 Tax=Oceanobacillus neutriphilus TaxID=531815 RepID=A0ABQ2P0F4_9BACI|nr:hypothetical protein [Oceanobacillus neutriphilus]GGP14925.1 hypothetical protein GCM10011346_40880 [Oceanobacillus neutriphilus]